MGDSAGSGYVDGYSMVTLRRRIITFFRDHPHSSPKEACFRLGLDYRKHGQYVRNLKSLVNRNYRNQVLVGHQQAPKISPFLGKYGAATIPSGPRPRIHALEMSLSEPLSAEHVSLIGRAAGRGEGGWSLSSNRNGMLVFRGSGIALRVWRTGRASLVSSLPDGESALSAFIGALVSAGLKRGPAIVYASRLEYVGHHEVFRVGKTFLVSNPNPFVEVKAVAMDGSHPNDLELHCRRKVPAPLILPWVDEALV